MKFILITLLAGFSMQCFDATNSTKTDEKVIVDSNFSIESNADSIANEFTVEQEITETALPIIKTRSTTEVDNQEVIDRDSLISFAKSFLGTPYVYGRKDPKVGFDCSGFNYFIFENFNITVPRSSSGFKNFGKKIAVEDVKIGDVLIFKGYRDSSIIGHVGIVYEANGADSKFIHASSGKAMQVTISELNSAHYSKRFMHAVDVINE